MWSPYTSGDLSTNSRLRLPPCVSPKRNELRFYFRLHAADIAAVQVTAFLSALDRELGAPWLLLWDRLNAHRARHTRDFLLARDWSPASFFPSYAPELNPVEYAWCWLKNNPLANWVRLDLDSLAAAARLVAFSTNPRCCAPFSGTALFFCASNRPLLMQESIMPGAHK